MISLDRIVLLIGGLSAIFSLGCSAQVQEDPAAYGLYFTPEAAPKQVARPANDGLSQILKLGDDLEGSMHNGGYSGRQVLSTLKEDRQAAEAMMVSLEPYVTRAHKALHSPSLPYVFDPNDSDIPMPPGRSKPLFVAIMLRAAASVKLAKSEPLKANQDLEDLLLLSNLMGTIPSAETPDTEKMYRGLAIATIESFADAYHNSPKARAELKDIFDRKRARIPVIDRIRNHAYYMVRYSQSHTFDLTADQSKTYVEGQKIACAKLAKIAIESGDDYEEFNRKLDGLSRKQSRSNFRGGTDRLSLQDAIAMEITKFASLRHLNFNNTQVMDVKDDLVHAWLAAEAYRDAHGVFPARLEDAGFVNRLDPYSKKPYHYEAKGAAMKVWSVGPGGVDHGGIQSRSFDGNVVLSVGGAASSG